MPPRRVNAAGGTVLDRFFLREGGFELFLPVYENALIIKLAAIQTVIPIKVGSRAAATVHLMLPVSFFTVIRVVEQGQ